MQTGHWKFLVTNSSGILLFESDTQPAAEAFADSCRTICEIYSQRINHCICGGWKLVVGVERDVDGNDTGSTTNVCENCGRSLDAPGSMSTERPVFLGYG